MREVEAPFEIVYEGQTASVVEAEIRSRRIFHIRFADNRAPLSITVAEDRKEVKFWTSIPEGRQDEAEKVGRLIAAYIRSKKK